MITYGVSESKIGYKLIQRSSIFCTFPPHLQTCLGLPGKQRERVYCSTVSHPFLHKHNQTILSNYQAVLLWEAVFWNFQVHWCWSLSYTARDVVVTTMTRAEPTTKITSLTDRHATKMCADTYILLVAVRSLSGWG